MEELLRQLTEVSLRQQQIVEHLAARQGQVDEEVTALRMAARQRVPLPDPRVQAAQLLPKMTTHNDVEAYLQMFENTATAEGWDPEVWARALAPLLTGEPQRAYFSLPTTIAGNYGEVKREILARVGLSPVCAAQQFADWVYQPRRSARTQATELTRLAQHWLMVGSPSAAQVTERVIIDRLLRALPRACRHAVGMRNPTTVLEVVEAIELAEAAQRREAGERVPPFPRRVVPEQRAPEGISRPIDRAAAPEPVDESMPTAPSSPKARPWVAGCVLHQDPPRGAPTAEVKINGRPFKAVLDTGSAVSLVKAGVLPPSHETKGVLPVTCAHGDTREVPIRRVSISASAGTWAIEVGIVKGLPVSVLLGRDWPGFEALLSAATQPANPRGGRRGRPPAKRPNRRPVLLASDSGRDGESPSQNPNLFYDVYQQVVGGGSFGRAQREDDRLKHCWTQVCVLEGKDTRPKPILSPTLSWRMACSIVSPSVGGRKKSCWWFRARRRSRSCTWPTLTQWQDTSARWIPSSVSGTVSTGLAWRPMWNASVRRAPRVRRRRPSHLPPHSITHHRGALRAHRDGSGRAVAEVSAGTWAHPGRCGLCHPVPRSNSAQKSHGQNHRSRALPAVQPGGHSDGDTDRSGNTVYVPANGWSLPAAPGKAPADHRIPSPDRRARGKIQPDPQTNAAEGGSRRPAGLGPDAPLCPFWYTGGSAGINGLYTVWAPLRTTASGTARRCQRSLGTTTTYPTPVPRRACLRDEAADRSHHAISPGTPGTRPAGPTTLL